MHLLSIAPVFLNTMEDVGALPIERSVDNLHIGDIIDVYPYKEMKTSHGKDGILHFVLLPAPFARTSCMVDCDESAGHPLSRVELPRTRRPEDAVRRLTSATEAAGSSRDELVAGVRGIAKVKSFDLSVLIVVQ